MATPQLIYDALASNEKRTVYEYPWNTLEHDLENAALFSDNSLSLVGYGSLINRNSATATLTSKTTAPILVYGVKRIFNYLIPDNTKRYGSLSDTRYRAALNVTVTGNGADYINGIAITLTRQDVEALRAREVGYDLIRVPCLPWDSGSAEPNLAWVWILSCSTNTEPGRKKIDTNILPNSRYYAICRDGAASYGEDFLATWLRTTCLADGTTSMVQYENNNPNISSEENQGAP